MKHTILILGALSLGTADSVRLPSSPLPASAPSFASASSLASSPRVARRAQAERVVLGVKLRPEMQAWLVEIERRLGKELYAERAPLGPEDGGDGFVGGENYITARGTAILRVNIALPSRDERRIESIIAHELLHLRQRARGFPVFEIDDAASSADARRFIDERIIGDMLEGIEHYMFSPDMRRLGLDTVADMIGGLRRAQSPGGGSDDPVKTLYFFRALLEYNNPSQVEELRRAYRGKGWTRSIQRGESLAQIVRRANLQTPSDVTATYLRGLTTLYGGAFKFTARAGVQQVARDRIHPTIRIAMKTSR